MLHTLSGYAIPQALHLVSCGQFMHLSYCFRLLFNQLFPSMTSAAAAAVSAAAGSSLFSVPDHTADDQAYYADQAR